MNAIFDIFNKNGLIKRNKVLEETIASLTKLKIEKLVNSINDQIELSSGTTYKGHCHISSFSLSGSGEECSQIGCRLKKVDQLARFSALYSDVIYIRNPFDAISSLDDELTAPVFCTSCYESISQLVSLS